MRDVPGAELAVILPVDNEGEAVEPVLRALSAGVRTPHELVVVYDFDGDTTVPVVVRLAVIPTDVVDKGRHRNLSVQ